MSKATAQAATEARTSMDDVIDRYKQDVDLSLVRDMLGRPAGERFQILKSLLELTEELRSSTARLDRR